MKAVLFESPGEVRITEVPDPVVGPEDVLIAVKAAGICGTDVHIYEGDFIATYPLIPGHEFAGEVIDVGKAVQNFKPGDRVAVYPTVFCRKCSFCRENRENSCTNRKGYGVHVDGGFAEMAAIRAENAYHIDGLSYLEGAMVEPVSCGVYGIRQVGIDIGDHVLIFGCGPIGLILMQLCMDSGAATVTVVDTVQEKLDLAKKLGGANTLLADDDLPAKLRELRQEGFQVAVDATGSAPVVQSMFNYVRDRGRLLFFGVCPANAKIEISPYEVYKRELRIYGSLTLLYTASAAIEMMRAKRIDTEALISHRFPLNDFMSAFNFMMEGAGSMKIMIEPTSEV